MDSSASRGRSGVSRCRMSRRGNWLAKGKAASEVRGSPSSSRTSRRPRPHRDVRALGIVYKELPDNPMLAWKFLERREPGFQPPGRERNDEQLEDQEQQKTLTDELADRRRRLT